MSDETPRLQLKTFEPGEQWDHTDTVEAVDKHAIAHGPISERPADGEYDDELFHATDQGITWRWDSAAEDWTYFSGNGTAQQPVPGTSHFENAEATHVRSSKRPVWNVEAHGIEGDGTTPVGQAVHELFDEVDAAGGGIVYFPPGRYLFERTPLIGSNTMVVGAGASTVFQGQRDGDTGLALISNTGYDQPGYQGASNWGIRDIRIDSPATNGIMPAHAENVRLENIYGERIYYHHIDIVSSKNVTVDGYWATRGGEGDSDAPMQFDNQTPGTTRNRVLRGNSDEAVEDDGTPTQNCTIQDFEIDVSNNPNHGIHIHRDGNHSVTIKDGYISGCQFTAIRGDTARVIGDLSIHRVSCIDNARGITLGELQRGRQTLTISDVTIRTNTDGRAAGSGLYASGFESASIDGVTVDGPFENSIIFDNMTDLNLSNVTAVGAENQGFRLRNNVDATLTNGRVRRCGAGLFVSEDSSLAYGGFSVQNVGNKVVANGNLRDW